MKLIAFLIVMASLHVVMPQAHAQAQPSDFRPLAQVTDIVKVTIIPSTTKVVRGSVYGLSATIQNSWATPISLDMNSVQLVTVPELAPVGYHCTWSYYDSRYRNQTIILQPGNEISVFFDLGQYDPKTASDDKVDPPQVPDACKRNLLKRVRDAVDFNPEDYPFTVTGKLTVIPVQTSSGNSLTSASKGKTAAPSSPLADPAYFINCVQKIRISISQWDTIGFSFLGSVLAALVVLCRSKESRERFIGSSEDYPAKTGLRIFVALRNGAGGVLTAVAATVLTSRLSDTAFPVKISIDDFWGALVVGFVAFFVGGKIIDKIARLPEKR